MLCKNFFTLVLNHPALLPLTGVKIIFRVGLVLLKCMLGTREKLKACQGQYETMELLRAIEPRYMQEGFLVREVTAEWRRRSVLAEWVWCKSLIGNIHCFIIHAWNSPPAAGGVR